MYVLLKKNIISQYLSLLQEPGTFTQEYEFKFKPNS